MANKAGSTKRAFGINLDVTELTDLADRLVKLNGEQFNDISVQTVNDTLDYSYTLTRQAMEQRINLPQSYIDGKMLREPAQPGGRALARLSVNGQLTIFTRFPGYKVLTKPINDPSYVQRYGRKGNAQFGIPVGRKIAGVQVQVLRGHTTTWEHGFLMRLKNGNGYGLFARSVNGGKPIHRYGPAVYSLFREQLDLKSDQISSYMVGLFGDRVETKLREFI